MSFSPDKVSNKQEGQVTTPEVSGEQKPSVKEIMANGKEDQKALIAKKYNVETVKPQATDLEIAEGIPYTFMSNEAKVAKKGKIENYIADETDKLNNLSLNPVKELENTNMSLAVEYASVQEKIKEQKAKLSSLKPKSTVSRFFSGIANKFKSEYSVDEYSHTQKVLANYEADRNRLSSLIDANQIIIERAKSA